MKELTDGFIEHEGTIYCDICMLENLAKGELNAAAAKIGLMQSVIDMCRNIDKDEDADEHSDNA